MVYLVEGNGVVDFALVRVLLVDFVFVFQANLFFSSCRRVDGFVSCYVASFKLTQNRGKAFFSPCRRRHDDWLSVQCLCGICPASHVHQSQPSFPLYPIAKRREREVATTAVAVTGRRYCKAEKAPRLSRQQVDVDRRQRSGRPQ